MIKKLTFLILVLFSFTSCGYSPIYSNNNEAVFEIYKFELEGINEINNVIENKLEKYFNNNSQKKYIVKIKTSYQKNTATKDRTGSTTHFKLIVNLNLKLQRIDLEQNEKEREVSFSESLIIKKNSDNFEQNDYEKISIENMTELLINKVILYIVRN
tara:strand:+ start:1524 stop:1994 length:471 start_codon:yes stop_codon:yes gene_type:complete